MDQTSLSKETVLPNASNEMSFPFNGNKYTSVTSNAEQFNISSTVILQCVSRLFWVSSLAYPNLLGTKGYVVVVVVVVVVVILQCTQLHTAYIPPY
jgi:hypothetical protein